MRRRSNGPTISQVAEAAGVSRATVSRVLNNQSTVDPVIGAKVKAAANRLNYRPNPTARNLSTGRTHTVGVIVPDLANPMFQSILRGLSRLTEQDGYAVLLAEAPDPAREPVIARATRDRCDAIVLVSPRMDDAALYELVTHITPVALINRECGHPAVATVGINYARGTADLVSHLQSFGHRDFLYVAGPPGSAANRMRIETLERVLGEDPSARIRIIEGGATMQAGYGRAQEILDSGATAVLAFNDLVAFGILARLNEFGVTVPRDLSVTGFDGIELARFAVPSLTTLSHETNEVSERTWQLLRERIDQTANTRSSSGGLLLEPMLVVGDSTGVVPPSRIPVAESGSQDDDKAGTSALGKPLGWKREGSDWTLLHGGEMLAAATTGATMAPVHSPRPHLHPVRSLSGQPMTVTNPLDHRHHFGLSMAVPDLNGTTYWGGRTFLAGKGPTLLANHGRQEIQSAELNKNGRKLRSQVRWQAHDGRSLMLEDRNMAAFLPSDGWGLTWHSRLTPESEPLRFTSPANHGRLGAGYGGLFWRLPSADLTRVLVEGGEGESFAHGSASPFIIVQRRHGDEWTSLVMVQDMDVQERIDPWFVRVLDYVGISPSLAWDSPRNLPLGETLDVCIHSAIVDHQVDAGFVTEVLEAAHR